MTMPMNLHPQYIVDENGKKTSVVLSIEEYEELIKNSSLNDLSYLNNEIQKGFDSKLSTKTHKEIFQNLRKHYA